MTNKEKAKAYIRAIRKFLDKVPIIKEYTIHDENQIYDAFENNKDKWFWRFDITIVYYITLGKESDSDWVTKLHKYSDTLMKGLEMENILLPDIKFIAKIKED